MLGELLRFKKVVFAFLLTILCITVFFGLCVSLGNIFNVYSGRNAYEQTYSSGLSEELQALDSLTMYNVNDVSNVLLRIFNDETTIIDYGSSEKVKAEYANFYIHKIIVQGKYEDLLNKIDQLERIHPTLFIINVKIKRNNELRRNEAKTKNTKDLGAEITVMHCSF